ncbi:hypothetical protein KY284_030429 [Solanum tuberosum]|nr:hypothetical protein KY284_030429 [Solanum tuberosum]
MSQLIQVMRLTYLFTENEPTKGTCSTGQATEKAVAVEKGAEDNNIIDDWEEKDVLLRSWISGTLTEESMYLIVAIHKLVDEDNKVINFARGLGLKYKTFKTVMGQGRGNYSQRKGNNNFNSRGRDFKPAGQGTCSYNNKNGPGPQNSPLSESQERNNTDACQICGRNNHTALKYFYKWNYSYQATNELLQILAATNLQNTTDDTLYVISGASSHMTYNSGILTDLKHYTGPDKIIIWNGSKVGITHVGNISGSGLKLKENLVVPKINKNLLSVSKLAKDNCCTLEFDETNFVVKDKKTRTLLAKGYKRNGLYALKDNNLYVLIAAHDWNTSENMWHTILGHPNLKSLKVLNSNSYINDTTAYTKDIDVIIPLQGEFTYPDMLWEVQANSTQVTSDNATLTTHILLNNESIIDLSGVGSDDDHEEQVESDDPYSGIETPPTDFRSASGIGHQPDDTTLKSTTLVDLPVEVLRTPQGHHMITRHKAKEHHLSLVARSSKEIRREPNTTKEALRSPYWLNAG